MKRSLDRYLPKREERQQMILRITPELKNKLRRLSKRIGVPLNTFVTATLERVCDEEGK